MWGEIGDRVFSEENRIERMLLADRRNILEIWRKVFGDLEKPVWQNTMEIWRNVFGDLEKRVRRFGETCSAQLWRFRIGVRYGVAESSAIVSGD